VYARDVDNYPEPLTFGVSGKLIMNVLVMYDRQTESYWSQILGQAVEGELTGTELTAIPALQTTWKQWRELHPETLALRKGYSSANDPYINYYASGQAGVIGETTEDDRVSTKAMGIGFVVNDQPAFFPISAVRDETLANDEIAGEPVLVVYRPEAVTGFAFSRNVDDQILTFSVDDQEEGDESTPNLIDAETGSRWSVFNGVAIDGPLAGKTLERIPSTTSFWFGWKDFHPDTYVYGVNEATTP
jgi:hypothetical protein